MRFYGSTEEISWRFITTYIPEQKRKFEFIPHEFVENKYNPNFHMQRYTPALQQHPFFVPFWRSEYLMQSFFNVMQLKFIAIAFQGTQYGLALHTRKRNPID